MRIRHSDQIQTILVAHGTRAAHGVNTVARLADLVRQRIGVTKVAFVDVLGPSPAEVLRDTPAPALVIPAFLAAGYHVRTDIPAHVAASGHSRVTVCENLGPDPALAAVMRDRLRVCGWRPGDAVVMAAAGSSDEGALADVELAAQYLGHLVEDHIEVGYVTTATPSIPDAVRAARSKSERRVFIAPYLLAPGLFHSRLGQFGADGVAAPLGADARIAALIVDRVEAALDDRVAARHRSGLRYLKVHAHTSGDVRTM